MFHYAGVVYSCLSGALGRIRDLSRGYTYWASGRLSVLKVNCHNRHYCHVRSAMKPSMKVGTYKVYLLLGRTGNFATVVAATCEYAAGYVYTWLDVTTTLHKAGKYTHMYMHVQDCDITKLSLFLFTLLKIC